MRTLFYRAGIAAAAGLLCITACNNPADPGTETTHRQAFVNDSASLANIRLTYQPGDEVPTEFVCMKTDEYREMRQLEIFFEGRAYYGCCDKCQELLTTNASMRSAIDPFTSETVDKATAYIVLTGNNNKVMYFASEENYRRFLAQDGR